MNEPKTIYVDVDTIEEGDNYQVDAYLSYKMELSTYTSVNRLKEWIEERKKRIGNHDYTEIDELLKYLEEK